MADDLSMDGFGESLAFGSSNELSADFVAGLSRDDPLSLDQVQDDHEFQLEAGDISAPDEVSLPKAKRKETGWGKNAIIPEDFEEETLPRQASEPEE